MPFRTRRTLNDRLEAIRQERGTTKKDLSLACSRAPAYWSKMLTEEYVPSHDVVKAFCTFYKIDADLTKSLLDEQALSCRSAAYPAIHAQEEYAFSCSFCSLTIPGYKKPKGWRVKAYRLHCPAQGCKAAALARYKSEWTARTRERRRERRAKGLPAWGNKKRDSDNAPWDASDWGYGVSHVRMEFMELSPMAEAFLPPMPRGIRRYGG